jgi:hypothetical protein
MPVAAWTLPCTTSMTLWMYAYLQAIIVANHREIWPSPSRAVRRAPPSCSTAPSLTGAAGDTDDDYGNDLTSPHIIVRSYH